MVLGIFIEGHQAKNTVKYAFLHTLRRFPDVFTKIYLFLNGSQRCFYVGSVLLIAHHCQERLVRRQYSALRQIWNLGRIKQCKIKSKPLARQAAKDIPVRNLKSCCNGTPQVFQFLTSVGKHSAQLWEHCSECTDLWPSCFDSISIFSNSIGN